VPVQVQAPLGQAGQTQGIKFINAIAVGGALGAGTSCAVRSETDGRVFCWGADSFGQLGNDTNAAASKIPVEVQGITNAKAISVGLRFACAVVGNPGVGNQIFCWGTNTAFQLGSGVLTGGDNFSLIPQLVGQVSNTTVAISSGDNHTCVVNTSSVVHCWGSNSQSQISSSSAITQSGPRIVSGFSAAVKTLSAGAAHTCATLVSGSVACWGSNATGQLGDGTNTTSGTPVTVQGISDAVAVAAGNTYSCALRATGAVLCWGQGLRGQLGNTATSSLLPVVVQGLNDAVAITAGDNNTCALRANNTLVCWGASGLLGSTTTADSNIPLEVTGGAIFGR
jgi:alpha-tubulin suppressor-like RCC1 family protein